MDDHLALQVNGFNENAFDVTIAPTDARTSEQNTCMPTLHADMPNNFLSTPTFVMGPIDVPVSLAGYEVTLYEAKATATFAADGIILRRRHHRRQPGCTGSGAGLGRT